MVFSVDITETIHVHCAYVGENPRSYSCFFMYLVVDIFVEIVIFPM